ncbi:MAG: hypothetical protein Q4G03_00915 [Planctomycetia bacterium]|nr:hypothetical protein [Planctomycetia bacterium]
MTLSSIWSVFLINAITWIPNNVTQFWLTPEVESTICFSTSDGDLPQESPYVIRTTDGEILTEGLGKIDKGELSLDVKLPQGYFELELPDSEQSFGMASQPAFCHDCERADDELENARLRDEFFGIDAASTWLVHNAHAREDLIRNARRMGIATYRERLNWGRVEPEKGKLDLNADGNASVLRDTAKKYHMPVLELFHNAPEWAGRWGTYPSDLIATADTWGNIAEVWASAWNSIEVWNEPDIFFSGNMPADQYVPVLKSVGQELARRGVETPVVGGIIANFQDDFMSTLARNGVIDACDIFSFHTYCRAYDMENVSLRYCHWLEMNKAEWKPLWITECGRPWQKGTNRPNREADLLSAIDIVEKGVAAKALGIDAYFPFVYVYYEENDNNFGMSDRNNAPLRSSAGYARMIQLLSDKRCIGTWKLNQEGGERSYLFIDTTTRERVATLYARSASTERRVTLPCKPTFVERVTGEPVEVQADGSVAFKDGFLFIGLPNDYQAELTADSEVDKARNLRFAARVKHGADPRGKTSCVARFDFDSNLVEAKTSGYRILDPKSESLTGTISVFNFSDATQLLPITAYLQPEREVDQEQSNAGLKTSVDSISVEPRSVASFEFTLDTKDISPLDWTNLVFNVADDRLVVRMIQTLEESSFRKAATTVARTDISDQEKWRRNCTNTAQMTFTSGLESAEESPTIGFEYHFEGDADRWAYPIFPLIGDDDVLHGVVNDGTQTQTSIEDCRGFAFKVAGTSNAPGGQLRFFTYDKNGRPYYYTAAGIAPTDGEEHFVVLPFSALVPYEGAGKFNPLEIGSISIGGNSKGSELTVKVGDFYWWK